MINSIDIKTIIQKGIFFAALVVLGTTQAADPERKYFPEGSRIAKTIKEGNVEHFITELNNFRGDSQALLGYICWEGWGEYLRENGKFDKQNEQFAMVEAFFMKFPDVSPNFYDRYGSFPLYWACNEGSVRLVRLLLEHGADPLRETQEDKKRAFDAVEDYNDYSLMIRRGGSEQIRLKKEEMKDLLDEYLPE